jgi:hypothetical protein
MSARRNVELLHSGVVEEEHAPRPPYLSPILCIEEKSTGLETSANMDIGRIEDRTKKNRNLDAIC